MKRIALLMGIIMLWGGCDDGGPVITPQGSPPAGNAAPNATALPEAREPSVPSDEIPVAPPPMVQEPAHAGMGAKGHYGGPGLVTTPVAAYWRVQDRLAINQIVHDMQIYAAINGGPPKTHDEFMEKIIQAGGIRLPALEAEEKYLYDPAQVNLPESTGLMVQRPAQ